MTKSVVVRKAQVLQDGRSARQTHQTTQGPAMRQIVRAFESAKPLHRPWLETMRERIWGAVRGEVA